MVREEDLEELLPLMRAYCDFYEVAPADDALLGMSRALIAAAPADDAAGREGLQLLARDLRGRAVAFATVFWTWQTLTASRIAVMNDLYVLEHARGTRIADALIDACAEHGRAHGATHLVWQTAQDNERAQAVYERVGARRSDEWLDYVLPLGRELRG